MIARGDGVVLDKSCLHGDGLGQLERSALPRLSRSGVLKLCHPDVLVEETLRLFKREDRGLFQTHLRFLLSLGGTWQRPALDAIAKELQEGIGVRSLELSASEELKVETTLRRFATDPPSAADLESANSEDQIYLDIRETTLEVRREFKERTTRRLDERGGTYEELRTQLPFSGWWEAEGVSFCKRYLAEKVLRPRVGDKADALIEEWESAPNRYPLTTNYARGYGFYYYTSIAGKKKDLRANDQEDFKLLASAVGADVVVSNDTGFFVDCFEALYGGTEKRLLTSTAFISEIDDL